MSASEMRLLNLPNRTDRHSASDYRSAINRTLAGEIPATNFTTNL